VSVRALEIDAASTVVMIDLIRLVSPGIGPVAKALFANPPEDLVELRFAYQGSGRFISAIRKP